MEQEQRLNQAWSLFNAGKYSDAAVFFEDAIGWAEMNHGPGHKDTLQLRDALSKCFQKSENFKEAKDLNQETLRLRENLQGKDHPETIETRHALAASLSRLGRYKDSIELHHLNILYQDKSASQNYKGMLETRRSLASELYKIGESEEALKVDERSQKLAELMVSVTTLNHALPDQKDSMAIVADGEEWVVIRSSDMKEWREKLTQRAEEREELLRTKKVGGTRKGGPSKRIREGEQKENGKKGGIISAQGVAEASRLRENQELDEEDISKAHFNQRSKNGPTKNAKKSPQINVEAPNEGAPKIGAKIQPPRKNVTKPSDSTAKGNNQPDNSEVGRLSPGIHRPRAKSTSIHDRITAGFKHVYSSEVGSSAPSLPTRISWDGSQSKILEGVRHVNSSRVNDNTSRPSSAGGVAGEKRPGNVAKPNSKTSDGSGTGGGKTLLDQTYLPCLTQPPSTQVKIAAKSYNRNNRRSE